MNELLPIAWEEDRLAEALAALAQESHLIKHRPPDHSLPSPGQAGNDDAAINRWIQHAAISLHFEAEPIRVDVPNAGRILAGAAPALLRLDGDKRHYLAVLRATRRKVLILDSRLKRHRVSLEQVRGAFIQAETSAAMTEVDRLLEATQIPAARRHRARAALWAERFSQVALDRCWQLRLAPNASFWRKSCRIGLPRRLATFVLAYAGYYIMWIASWWLLGQSALEGRIDRGWLMGWALLLFSQVPFQMLAGWSQRMAALGAGMLLKQHLLYGATRLDPNQAKEQGTGQLLGKVIESESIELLSLTGVLLQIVAILELAAATTVFLLSPTSSAEVWLLASWTGVACIFALRYFKCRQRWTQSRLELSQYLIEQMTGYRTALAQQRPQSRYLAEDQRLEEYLKLSRRMDQQGSYLASVVTRGWLVVGLLGLTAQFLAGPVPAEAAAVAIGGLLLAYRALGKLCNGLGHLIEAQITWKQISPLFQAARQPILTGSPVLALQPAALSQPTNGVPLVEACQLAFNYPNRSHPVITDCSLRIHSGEHFLLQGMSGSGKSTLIGLLMGLYTPRSGLLLFSGLDRQTLGHEAWGSRILAVPQFHQNYMLTESLAFNLLLGRGWPPRHEDLQAAETICRQLGLGDLLDRMPAGLQQVVGESGWALSHGERSRIFIARALLQNAPLLILDEGATFLDPENLQTVMNYVQQHVPTLVMVAHP